MKTAALFLSISILLIGCYDESDYKLPTAIDGVLLLRTEPGDASIPADGQSRIKITATITGQSDPDKRTIIFETTSGTLLGGAASGSGRAVAADANGEAVIELQSATVAAAAVVTATIQNVAGLKATIEVQFTPVNPFDNIRFVTAPSSAPADGATISTFVLEVKNAGALAENQRSVTFSTTLGTLVEQSTQLDGQGRATAFLRSHTEPGEARLRATLGTFVTDAIINFHPALPETLAVTSDKFAIKNNLQETATISIQLRRSVGKVTSGTRIDLVATDEDGASVGIFKTNPLHSDMNGAASTDFAIVGAEVEGIITVTATVPAANISDSTTVQVNKDE